MLAWHSLDWAFGRLLFAAFSTFLVISSLFYGWQCHLPVLLILRDFSPCSPLPTQSFLLRLFLDLSTGLSHPGILLNNRRSALASSALNCRKNMRFYSMCRKCDKNYGLQKEWTKIFLLVQLMDIIGRSNKCPLIQEKTAAALGTSICLLKSWNNLHDKDSHFSLLEGSLGFVQEVPDSFITPI